MEDENGNLIITEEEKEAALAIRKMTDKDVSDYDMCYLMPKKMMIDNLKANGRQDLVDKMYLWEGGIIYHALLELEIDKEFGKELKEIKDNYGEIHQ